MATRVHCNSSFKIATANGLYAQTLLSNTDIPPLGAVQEFFGYAVAKSQTLMCKSSCDANTQYKIESSKLLKYYENNITISIT